ncbi:kinase [Mesorhizobium sp. SB112]|uniref:GHMP family kinase ATP-binding protein n=1 Tax=Mesorhizobium sp. SB112 TaxID=3151853 RepID=UPI003265E9D6
MVISENLTSQVTAQHSDRVGTGQATAHHGELVQGVFENASGGLQRGLVTLPLDRIRSLAKFKPSADARIDVIPPDRTKAKKAARLTLKHMACSQIGGELTITSSIAVGHGYGSSTADVVAAIRAVAAAHGIKLRRSTICQLAVAAEGASDAITYEDQAILFAHRDGSIIEHFNGPLPPLISVGFKASDGKPVDTIAMPRARYNAEEIQTFHTLRGLVARSIACQDPFLLGRASTVSAQISQRYLPKSRFDTVLNIARHHGACGVQVAHSGSLIGILLDATSTDARAKASEIAKSMSDGGFKDAEIHSVNTEEAFENAP